MIKFLLFLPLFVCAKTSVWLDMDIAYGKTIRDPDDGLALITILESEQLDLKGISLGFGNIDNLDYMERITKQILRQYKSSHVPVYKGMRRFIDHKTATPASMALAAQLSKGPLHILATGRLSNMKNLLVHFPHVGSSVKSLIINAGRRLETQTRVGRYGDILPDTNIDDDKHSASYVTRRIKNLVLIPVESMSHALIRKRHLKKLRKRGGRAKKIQKNIRLWRFIWRLYPGMSGFIPWDIFVVAYLTHPDFFSCETDIPIKMVKLKNNTTSIFRKKYKKRFKDFLVSSYKIQSDIKGTYCYHIKAELVDNLVDLWRR